MQVEFSVFTKPWKMPLPALAEHVKALGFDGIELPVRPGFQVTPDDAEKGLQLAERICADNGIKILSIASDANERIFAACAGAGIPLVRIMAPIRFGNYLADEQALRRKFDSLLPHLESTGVKLGVQNHCGRFICNSAGLRALVSDFDPARIGVVWDAAHNALSGEEPEFGLEIIWRHLALVNLKNAVWIEKPAPGALVVGYDIAAEWTENWVIGRNGLASWPRVSRELRRRDYSGIVCLTAEYSDSERLEDSVAEDIAFARSLFT